MRSWVVPVHPGKGCQFEVVGSLPWAFPVDAFGLVEPVGRLREGVVVRIADGAYRRCQTGLG